MIAAVFRRLSGLLLACCFLSQTLNSSCATTEARTNIVVDRDDFEGTTNIHTIGNRIAEEKAPSGEFIYEIFLNAMRLDWRYGETLYFLVVRYNGKDWAMLDADKPLALTIDGDRLALSGEGAGAEDRAVLKSEQGPYRSERLRYQVSADQMRKLAGAESVTARLAGKNRSFDIQLSQTNIDLFRDFTRSHVTK